MCNCPAKTTSQKRHYGSKFSRQPRFIADFPQNSSKAVSTSTQSSGSGRRMEPVAPRCLPVNIENPDMPNTYKKPWNHEQHYISDRPPMLKAVDRTAITNDLLITPLTAEDRYRDTRNKSRNRRKEFTPFRQVASCRATAIPYHASDATHRGSELIKNAAISTESKVPVTNTSLSKRTMTKSAQENRYNNQQKKHDSRMAVLSRNQSECAANSTDEQYFGTRQYSIKRETEIKSQKNLDTTASCKMANDQ